MHIFPKGKVITPEYCSPSCWLIQKQVQIKKKRETEDAGPRGSQPAQPRPQPRPQPHGATLSHVHVRKSASRLSCQSPSLAAPQTDPTGSEVLFDIITTPSGVFTEYAAYFFFLSLSVNSAPSEIPTSWSFYWKCYVSCAGGIKLLFYLLVDVKGVSSAC